MRLSKQISLLILGSVFLSMLVASIYFSCSLRSVLLQQKLESLNNQMNLRVQTFETHIDQLKDDVALLSENPLAKKLLTSANTFDADFEALLANEFYNFLDTRQQYFQIRLLSPEGKELIRLDKTSSSIGKVKKEFLQDKSGRYYIDAITHITPKTVWLSPIDLNHELGVISQPETTTIRAAMLVTDENKNTLGIVIINMDAGPFLESVSQIQENSMIFIVNQTGEFLAHPDSSLTFASDRGHKKLLSTLYPELNYETMFLKGKSDNRITIQNEGYIYSTHLFEYDKISPKNNIRIIHLYGENSLISSTNSTIFEYLIYASGLFFFIALLTFLMSRRIRYRLQKLSNVLQVVNRNEKASIKIEHPEDEIDDILLTFKTMLETIDDREQSLISSENRIQTVLNTVLNGVITISKTGNILAINTYGAAIFEYEPEELVGKKINLLMPKHDADDHDALLANYRVDGEKRVINKKRVLYGQTRTGKLFPISLTVSELFFDGDLHFVGAIDDISERLENEKRISAYSRQLERSNQDLERFAYMASHDLQEPARKMESFSSLLLLTENENISNEGRRILERNMLSARHMRDLINSVLALSRIDKIEFSETEVDLSAILEKALDELQSAIQTKKAIVHVEPLHHVRGDETQLTQLFVNLIGNSLKFVEAGIHPVIYIKAYSQFADSTQALFARGFCVEDNGIGIAPENRERIFKPFERLGVGKKYQGYGMGLALCHRIVEFHEGNIKIESIKPNGTRFTVSFP